MRALVILALAFPAVLLACPAVAQDPVATGVEPLPPWRPERPGSQVVLEFALAMPGGDLGDDFNTADLGFGAGNGLELGFRWRFHLSPGFSLAPYFHFTDYDDHEGYRYDAEEEETVDARIKCSDYSFGVEARYALRRADDLWRPFGAVAAGLVRNRVEGWRKDYEKAFDESIDTLGLSARVGLRIDQFELSGVYRYNRFTTWRLFDTGQEQAYDWDSLVIRAGWILAF